ncbi:MAG: Tm-1-like ATP-binding domain-containing protein [Alphaproteobacteria bacterium]|nr:Tm-1-like ATP-binding domain-containing protein [Alphaproteobacteria bacterium]
MSRKTILLVGTYDTKQDELTFLASTIQQAGGRVLAMDVSVLGDASVLEDASVFWESDQPVAISKHDVAAAAGMDIAAVIASPDENLAMQAMARGAAKLAGDAHLAGKFDGVLALGGSMGTDLALDLCAALPIGVPKYIISTVAFSPMIPPARLPADIQMILWAGGLYGLSSVCKSALSQAAGAVLGACQTVLPPDPDKPMIGMTSLGLSTLTYMADLKPELEARGFEVAVFHATGMGGRAFESLASQGTFAAVMDFCTQELGNHVHGSSISAGDTRLKGAGAAATPQIVAPGCYDLVDVIGWQELDDKWQGYPTHAHNRLITSVVLREEDCLKVADAHLARLAAASGATALLLPLGGCGEWDRPGADLYNPDGLRAFMGRLLDGCPDQVDLHRLNAHINDAAFCEAALSVLDSWLDAGLIPRPAAEA